MKRLLGLILLPLSVLPFLAVLPSIVHSHERFQREHKMGPLPAPVAGQTPGEAARYPAFDAPAGQIPVLVWHGVGPARDGYSVTQAEFARQIELLKRLGYESISTRQWADFRAGHTAGLPAKPIVLTFDDGRLDSYRGADRVLQDAGMRAAMFVLTEEIEKGNSFYLSWSELQSMRKSGRWDIEPHAHAGHHEIVVSTDGAKAPFYAARRYTRSQGVESLAAWESRVSSDLFAVRERFAVHAIEPQVFAVPYGDYGQRSDNDPAIEGLLSGLLTRQFGNWFVQADDNDPQFTVPGTGSASRYELRTGPGVDALYRWLRRHSDKR
jgi:peptidoglycan/xylan/chitin deacetylase (PgdA/CDA1 family)